MTRRQSDYDRTLAAFRAAGKDYSWSVNGQTHDLTHFPEGDEIGPQEHYHFNREGKRLTPTVDTCWDYYR